MKSAVPGSPATGLRRWGGWADAIRRKRPNQLWPPRRGGTNRLPAIIERSCDCPAVAAFLNPCLASLQRLQLIQRARPVLAQQPRQAAVGQHLAPCLAARAIVGFVVGVANPLHLFAAARARLVELSMDGELRPKRRHPLR